jgi:hypothetical protein
MKPRTIVLIAGAGLLAVGGWALFRPELLFVNTSVDEAFPAAYSPSSDSEPSTLLASGQFHDGAHETKGMATIYEVGGQRILRLSNFATSNGPDVRVLLVASPDATDNDTVKNAGSVELGKLKGNVGDQNYEVPAGVDLARYRSVTIWCNRFGVNFGTAPLESAPRAG